MSVSATPHGEGCACVRCTGFPAGHGLSTKHGAYAVVSLGPRAAEIAEQLRALVPGGDPVDGPAVSVLATVLARLERAMAALDAVDAATSEHPLSQYVGSKDATLDQFARLRHDAKGWANVALRGLDALALVPTSRGRLGLDVARAKRIDLTRLSERELDELEALVSRAELVEEVGLDA
jgi:hypothetical protein